MFPATSERVPRQTDEAVNDQIRRATESRIECYRGATRQEIDQRLKELDAEWDIERTLEANAASAAFLGCFLTATVDRRWIALPLAVTAFLFQHAVQGWCPPLPVFRRLGFRTMREIDEERQALKLLRGDYLEVSRNSGERLTAKQVLTSVRA